MLRRLQYGAVRLCRASLSHARPLIKNEIFVKKRINDITLLSTSADFESVFHKCLSPNEREQAQSIMLKFLQFNSPSPRSISLALQCIKRCQLPIGLIIEVLDAHESSGVLDKQHFTIALGALKSNRALSLRSLALARRIVLQHSGTLDPILVASILSLYAELSDEVFESNATSILEDTFQVLNLQRERGMHIPQHQYGTSLVIAGRCGRLDVIDDICASAIAAGYEEDIYMLTALMTAYGNGKEYEKAMDAYYRVVELGLPLKTVTMTKVIDICIASGQTSLGLKIITDWLGSESESKGDQGTKTDEKSSDYGTNSSLNTSGKDNWEIYRGVVKMLQLTKTKDHVHKTAVQMLKSALKRSFTKKSIQAKVPSNLLAQVLAILVVNDVLPDIFSDFPYFLTPLSDFEFIIQAKLNHMLICEDVVNVQSLAERLQYHSDVSMSLKSHAVACCFGLLLHSEPFDRAMLYLYCNMHVFLAENTTELTGLFSGIMLSNSSHLASEVLIHLRNKSYYSHALFIEAVQECPFRDVLSILKLLSMKEFTLDKVHIRLLLDCIATKKDIQSKEMEIAMDILSEIGIDVLTHDGITDARLCAANSAGDFGLVMVLSKGFLSRRDIASPDALSMLPLILWCTAITGSIDEMTIVIETLARGRVSRENAQLVLTSMQAIMMRHTQVSEVKLDDEKVLAVKTIEAKLEALVLDT